MTNGTDHAKLAERWWQWAMSIPAARNPVRDQTGEFAAVGQPDDVWFLAGTFGGVVSRRCEIPAGRPILMPLFNVFHTEPTVPEAPRASGHAHLNGVELPVLKVVNEKAFKLRRSPTMPFLGGYRVRAFGLWSYLDGLTPGNYQLEIYGEERPGGFWVQVDYDLLVK